MAYNDIRNFEVNGSIISLGHPGMATYNSGENFNTTATFYMIAAEDYSGIGPVCVDAFTSTGERATIVIPVSSAYPQDLTYTCVATSTNMYPTSVIVTGAAGGSKVEITFSKAVSFNVTADVPCMELSSSGSVTQSTVSLSLRRTSLKEGVDYGTVTQRDALAHRAGQIFYVAVED